MTPPTLPLGDTENGPHIVVGDDHPLVLAALGASLQQFFPGASIRGASAVEEVIAQVSKSQHSVDLVLLDLNMPGNAGFAGLLLLLASFPGIPVAILSAQETPATIRKAITLGAAGYIPKTSSLTTMAEAIENMLDGHVWLPQNVSRVEQPESDSEIEVARRLAELSPQQLRILARLVEGKLNKQIASDLGIAEQTVKSHVSTILRKLNVLTRTEAAILVERCGKADPAAADCLSREVS